MSRGIADIAPARLDLLNAGSVASATLTEGLAIDFAQLLAAAGITRRMALAAQLLLEANADLALLQAHPSDTVRGWACFAIAAQTVSTLPQQLAAMRALADDGHFGVREWAWLALDGAARQVYFDTVGAIDGGKLHAAAQQFYAVWRFPDETALDALLSGIAATGWHDYFDTVNAAGPAVDFPIHLAQLAAAWRPTFSLPLR